MFLVTIDQYLEEISSVSSYNNSFSVWCWRVSCFLQLIPKHFCRIKVRTLTWSFQTIGFILLSLIFGCGSLSYCMTHFLLKFSSQAHVLTFSLRNRWWNSEFIASPFEGKLTWHKWRKTDLNHHTDTDDSNCRWDKVLMLDYCVFLSPNMKCLI